jgi:hypothetical protein
MGEVVGEVTSNRFFGNEYRSPKDRLPWFGPDMNARFCN